MATFLKLTREQLSIITGGDPRAIKAFEDFFTTLNNLGAHAPTHEPGGSDPLAVDAIPAVGSLRTLGTGAQKAAAGIHAGTHVTGGGDTIADAVAGGNAGLMSGADKTKLNSLAEPVTGTAAALAALNPVLAVGQLGWETDTLSGKIGDGATAYNSLTYFYRGLPVAGEPSLGTWHPILDPSTGYLATKTAGWTADRFTAASGGMEVDFTGTIPVGAYAVLVSILQATDAGITFARREGDPNVSNTPVTNDEYSQVVCSQIGRYRMVLFLSANQKAEIAVASATEDISISYPCAYAE
jgi:hypothetical protein